MSLRDVQLRLRGLGYLSLDADGLYGTKTETALLSALSAPAGERSSDPETDLLVAELRRDEGTVLAAYQDHLGYWTIGTGRLIDKRKGGGISQEENDHLLRNDIAKVRENLDLALPWWRGLDAVRQRAIQNMAFQLGIGGLMKFKNSLLYIEQRNWSAAASNLRSSLWAKQTPERAGRVIAMIEGA